MYSTYNVFYIYQIKLVHIDVYVSYNYSYIKSNYININKYSVK